MLWIKHIYLLWYSIVVRSNFNRQWELRYNFFNKYLQGAVLAFQYSANLRFQKKDDFAKLLGHRSRQFLIVQRAKNIYQDEQRHSPRWLKVFLWDPGHETGIAPEKCRAAFESFGKSNIQFHRENNCDLTKTLLTKTRISFTG